VKRWNGLLWALLVLCIVRLWFMPLGESFWTDETATAFVVRYSAAHPTLAIAPQLRFSIYYLLPWIADKLGGFSEVGYRLPSTLTLLAALFLIARLAARLIHPRAAWLVVFACLAMHGFNLQADDARPYALGTLTAVAAVWFLIRLLDSGKWLDAALFVVFGALLWRVQLVYWPFYLVFAVYAIARLISGDTPVRWPRALAVFAALGLALAPIVLDTLSLQHTARMHVIGTMPTLWNLLKALDPAVFLGVGAWLVARCCRWPVVAGTVSRSSLALTLAWWLIPASALFAFSWITGESLFVSRYFSLMLPGAALVGTAFVARYIPDSRWPLLSTVLGVGLLLALGQWNRIMPRNFNYDYRGAASAINQQGSGATTPVVCVSPFVEGRSPAWYPDYPLPSFLYAPLAVYPIYGHPYLFPFASSPEAEKYAGDVARTALEPSSRFFVYGTRQRVQWWQRWLARRLSASHWSSRNAGSFGEVSLVEFDRDHQM